MSIYKNISITPICSLKTCFIKSAKNNSNPKTIKELEKENIILKIDINEYIKQHGKKPKKVLACRVVKKEANDG